VVTTSPPVGSRPYTFPEIRDAISEIVTKLRTYSLPHLLTHRGRAVVFEDHADFHRRIDDESVAIDENSLLVLKQVGPRGAPGMPEWGATPIPAWLLKHGFRPTKASPSHS